jgi:hypothetical protein
MEADQMNRILLTISALLIAWPASAATYDVTGFDAGGNTVLSGTIAVDNGPLSAVDLTIADHPSPAHYTHLSGAPDCFLGDCASSPQGLPHYHYIFPTSLGNETFDSPTQTYLLSFDMFGQEGLWFTFSLLDGLITGGGFFDDGCGPKQGCPPPTYFAGGTVVPAPLPPSFLLFGTGLGALGLLGWRRKKTAAG